MFVLGGAATGLWLASTELVRLERNVVLALAGRCSFCGKERDEVHALVGTVGRATKICDECIGLFWEVLGEEFGIRSTRESTAQDELFQQRVGDMLQRVAAERESASREALMDDLRRSLHPYESLDTLRCSFCDAHRVDVTRMIAGPRVYICDTCVGEATAVVSHVLRAT
jgi:hypothetical protein